MRRRAALLLVAACSGAPEPGEGASGASAPALPDRPPPLAIEATPKLPPEVVIGRYRAYLRPKLGRWELTAVAGRNFDFGGGASTWTTCGAAPCLPPAGSIALYSDQSRVTYRDEGGECWSNGARVDCGTLPPECDQAGVFCGPIRVISNVTHGGARGALPDVVVTLAQDTNLGNEVHGCLVDKDLRFGHCDGSGKVDAPSSNLVSPIPGDGTLDGKACSYCFGNAFAAGDSGNPGLANAVLSGLDAPLDAVNEAHFALVLQSDADYGVDIVVYAARPAFAAAGAQIDIVDENFAPVTCALPGVSTVILNGAGFGPPGECLGAGAPSCPIYGTAGLGHTIEVEAAAGGTLLAPIAVWSDRQLAFQVPAGARRGRVRVTTPLGFVATDVELPVCLPGYRAHLVGGAGILSGGGIRARAEVGHGLRPQTAAGGNITLRTRTAVTP